MILAGLAQAAPALPVVSEEQAAHRTPVGARRRAYSLVDPLDGTKEFIAGRDEYTINIAIVAEGAPVLGIIAAPALGLIWRGIVGRRRRAACNSAVKRARNGDPYAAAAEPELVVAVSRSHLDARTQGLPGRPAARDAAVVRLFAQILPARRRCRRSLSAARPDPRMGRRGRPCDSRGRGRHGADARTARRYIMATPIHVAGFIAWGDPATASSVSRTQRREHLKDAEPFAPGRSASTPLGIVVEMSARAAWL